MQKVDELLAQYRFDNIIHVTLKAEAHRDGDQRWVVAGYTCDEDAWEQMVARLGWQIYLSTVPATRASDPDLVLMYRQQPRLERGISRLKSRNLHIRPVFLHDEQRISGLTWLLLLALRVIVLLEFRVRRELVQQQQAIVGLNPASKNQDTTRPTTERMLKAFGNITFSIVKLGDAVHHHVSPLTPTQQHILSLLHLSDDIYSAFA